MPNIEKASGWEREWGLFLHLAGFAMFVIPIGGGLILPLILWLLKKDESEWVNVNGMASINHQISIHLYIILTIPLVFIRIGILIIAMILIFNIVVLTMASVKAAKGQLFRYPLSIPFLQ